MSDIWIEYGEDYLAVARKDVRVIAHMLQPTESTNHFDVREGYTLEQIEDRLLLSWDGPSLGLQL